MGSAFLWTPGLMNENYAIPKRASHRGHGGHREGIRMGIRFLWTPGLMGENYAIPKRASHRGHGVTEGGLGWDPLFVDAGAYGRELCDSEESIAQRSRRPQRRD